MDEKDFLFLKIAAFLKVAFVTKQIFPSQATTEAKELIEKIDKILKPVINGDKA